MKKQVRRHSYYDHRHFNPACLQLAMNIRTMTQKHLAKVTGISAGRISQIRRGKKGCSKSEMWKFCKALHFPPAFFCQAESALGNRENANLW